MDLASLRVDEFSDVVEGGHRKGRLLMDKDAFAAAVEVKGIGTDKPVVVGHK